MSITTTNKLDGQRRTEKDGPRMETTTCGHFNPGAGHNTPASEGRRRAYAPSGPEATRETSHLVKKFVERGRLCDPAFLSTSEVLEPATAAVGPQANFTNAWFIRTVNSHFE